MKWMPPVSAVVVTILLLGCGGEKAPLTAQETEVPTRGTPKVKQYSQPPPMTLDLTREYSANIETNKGPMTVRLLSKEVPVAVNNFIFLAREGYYDNAPFHRIIKDFMVQSGDPTGTGSGGPGYTFEDEAVRRNYTRGIIAMANSGPNTNGSQFFIMHKAKFDMLKQFTIFGVVIFGMKVVDAIAETPVTASATGELSKPIEDVIIKSIEIIDLDGYGSPG